MKEGGFIYQIKCDGHLIYDPRFDDLIVSNPKCKLEVNTVGEASFSIYASHPHYDKIEKLKSIIEILQDGEVIFKGRVTNDTKDFNNVKVVDVEGVMGYFNDSQFRPFSFPEDWLDMEEYIEAAESGNVVEFLLDFIIGYHNSRVSIYNDLQTFKLGTVTVADPNNYILRESKDYMSAWECIKTKLFDSSLGGYLCIRYEEDGNYIDYLADFDETNTQTIKFGENLLDILRESDASDFFTAVVPLGAPLSEIKEGTDDSERLTIDNAEPHGFIDENIIHSSDRLINRTLAKEYGIIYAPIADTTWDDVKDGNNLLQKGLEYLKNIGTKIANTITIKAIDLHFSDDEIEAFRIYRYVNVESKPHGFEGRYRLTKLEIDIQNPQNTVILLGDTQLSMTDVNASTKKDAKEAVSQINSTVKSESKNLEEVNKEISAIKEDLQGKEKSIDDLQKTVDEIIDAFDDEWHNLVLDDAFALYGGLEANRPMYKVSGNIVEVRGCVVPVEEFTSGTQKVAFASGLPTKYCCDMPHSFVCQGSGMNRWMFGIETDGTLTISRYGVAEGATVPTTEGLYFSGIYMI